LTLERQAKQLVSTTEREDSQPDRQIFEVIDRNSQEIVGKAERIFNYDKQGTSLFNETIYSDLLENVQIIEVLDYKSNKKKLFSPEEYESILEQRKIDERERVEAEERRREKQKKLMKTAALRKLLADGEIGQEEYHEAEEKLEGSGMEEAREAAKQVRRERLEKHRAERKKREEEQAIQAEKERQERRDLLEARRKQQQKRQKEEEREAEKERQKRRDLLEARRLERYLANEGKLIDEQIEQLEKQIEKNRAELRKLKKIRKESTDAHNASQ